MAAPILVFDLDGTLIDTAPDLLDSLNHCLRTASIPEAKPEEMRTLVGSGSRVMIARAFANHGQPLTEGELDSFQALFLEHYVAGMPGRSQPFPGVRGALARFRDAGFMSAVCTNKLEHLSQELISALDLDHEFRAICGADTFAYRKPDPRHLIDTIRQAGGDPARAIMIGDSRTDIDTAKAAGIPVVAVDFGYTDRPVHEFQPDSVISHFEDLTLELASHLLSARTDEFSLRGP